MDWIKVKTKHYLHTSMSSSEIGAMVTIQLLTAHFERMPTEKEIKKHIHYKTLKSLQEYLNEQSISLQEVLNKVLIDVQHTVNLREKGKQKMANFREKKKSVTSNVTSIDKIREDKIREDKNKRKAFIKPVRNEIDQYCSQENIAIDIQCFIDFYDSNGWLVGKNKMKDWKATVRNWARREKKGVSHGKVTDRTQQSRNAVSAYIAGLEGQGDDSDKDRGVINITEPRA